MARPRRPPQILVSSTGARSAAPSGSSTTTTRSKISSLLADLAGLAHRRQLEPKMHAVGALPVGRARSASQADQLILDLRRLAGNALRDLGSGGEVGPGDRAVARRCRRSTSRQPHPLSIVLQEAGTKCAGGCRSRRLLDRQRQPPAVTAETRPAGSGDAPQYLGRSTDFQQWRSVSRRLAGPSGGRPNRERMRCRYQRKPAPSETRSAGNPRTTELLRAGHSLITPSPPSSCWHMIPATFAIE